MSAIAMMLVFAYLSKRLGEALAVKPYYRILFATSAAIVVVSGLETIPQSLSLRSISIITYTLRCTVTGIAFFVVLRYWKWLFAEFSKK
jgi:chromate transport protein ChrA